MTDEEYSQLPKEEEAETIADLNADLDLFSKTASEKPRVVLHNFRPNMIHPPTSLNRSARSHAFIYDPKDEIVHLGPAQSYHWELIQNAPELRAQYPMDRAYHEMSALSVPNHLHGRLELPDRQTDFMGLTADNSQHRDAVNAALEATSKPQKWNQAFSHTNTEGQHVGQIAQLTSQQTSTQEGRVRGAHQQEEAMGQLPGNLRPVLAAGEAGEDDD